MISTNRRHFIVALGGALAANAIATNAQETPPPAAPAPEPRPVPESLALPDAPTVHLHAQDTAIVVWGVKTGTCTGFVEYGETEKLGKVAKGTQLGMSQVDDRVIAIPLRGLTPGHKVFYRTLTVPLEFGPGLPMHLIKRGEAIASPVHSFTMPAADADTVKIGLWNDTHLQEPTVEALKEATGKFAPDLVVMNGDICDFNQQHELTAACLETRGGIANPRWPMVFSRGNHDVRGFFAQQLPQYLPPMSQAGYFGLLRFGPVAMLVMDTGEDKEGPAIYGGLSDFAGYRAAQRDWLEQAILDPHFTSAPFRLMFCHIPLRWKNMESTGHYCRESGKLWSPLLAKGKVQAVLSGHTHACWHGEPAEGQPFHQIIGGGPQVTSTKWSPTPATLTEITATPGELAVRMAEAASGKELITLKLNPVA